MGKKRARLWKYPKVKSEVQFGLFDHDRRSRTAKPQFYLAALSYMEAMIVFHVAGETNLREAYVSAAARDESLLAGFSKADAKRIRCEAVIAESEPNHASV